MKYVVGLGNPGRRYAGTRHNLGWMVLDEMAARLGAQSEKERWGGLTAGTHEVTLLKPMTFMNRSGRSVARLVEETGAVEDDLLIVMDDLDLTFGTVRMRANGSSGGHRGLQSVIERLGSSDIARLRLGIGPCPPAMDPRDFVLSRFEEEELPVVNRMVRRAAEAALCWVEEGVQAAMSRYNGPVEAPAEGAESGR